MSQRFCCIPAVVFYVLIHMAAVRVWYSWLLIATSLVSGAIHFQDFASPSGLSLVGDARVCGTAIRLTPARHDQAGAVWISDKQPVGSGFETTFQFRLSKPGGMGHGADGFAFVMQNAGPSALGGRGSAGGFAVADSTYRGRNAGIPWSIAVFFDTFRNKEEGDPSANFVSFRSHGRPSDMRWPADRLAFVPSLRIRLKDSQVHTARITFHPPMLSVFLDDSPTPVLEAPIDLSIVVDPQGSAWVGFTASTGGGYENHDILNWSFGRAEVSSNMSVVSSEISFHVSACLPDRNLCTPERALVEQNGSSYHVVLPANREWGASIPTDPARTVEVTNAHGIVCWDVQARGSDGCSGPSGHPAPAGAGFLDVQAKAGALIVQQHGGRTWFSVNGRRGAFHDNQGFYEFDLAIKNLDTTR